MKMYVVILCLVSLVVADDSVTYNSYNSSTVVPEINPKTPGHLPPMIVTQNNSDGGNAQTDHAMHSPPMEVEMGTELPSLDSNVSTLDSDFLSMSSSETGDSNATEVDGPTTKSTHIMKIPIKNTTASDMSDTTDSSMDKEASAATSEHGDHSKAAGSSASVVVVLTLFILSSRVLQSQ